MRGACVVFVTMVWLCRVDASFAQTPEAGAPDWFSQGANALTVPSSAPYYSNGTDVTRPAEPPATSAQPAQNAPPRANDAAVPLATAAPATTVTQPAPAATAPPARVVVNADASVQVSSADATAPAPAVAVPAPTTNVTVNVAPPPPPPPAPPPAPPPVGSATLYGATVERSAPPPEEVPWARALAFIILAGLAGAAAITATRPWRRPR